MGKRGRSAIRAGRIISEKRERLETKSERVAAHKKSQARQKIRLILTVVGFLAVLIGGVWLVVWACNRRAEDVDPEDGSLSVVLPYTPTVEVVDEDAIYAGGKLPTRVSEYIGQAEADFRDLGYIPVKVVIPAGAVREVDFYLDGYSGFVKLVTDRGTGVSVEDADRMIRYLAGIEVWDFEYIDVRVEGKGYWR